MNVRRARTLRSTRLRTRRTGIQYATIDCNASNLLQRWSIAPPMESIRPLLATLSCVTLQPWDSQTPVAAEDIGPTVRGVSCRPPRRQCKLIARSEIYMSFCYASKKCSAEVTGRLRNKKYIGVIAEDSNGHSARVSSDADKRRSSHGDVWLRRLRPRPVLRWNAADATSAAEAAATSTRCIRVGTSGLLSIRRSLLRVGHVGISIYIYTSINIIICYAEKSRYYF